MKFKRLLSVLLAVMMVVGMVPMMDVEVSAVTQSEFEAKLSALRSQYPNYSRWTDSFDGGTQCFGFARLMGYSVFGSYPSSWNKVYSIDNVKAGDLIQYGNTSGSGHTIFVTAVSGNTITFVDCNGNGNYSGGVKVRTCGIKWDNTITKGALMFGKYSFSYIISSPGISSSSEVLHNIESCVDSCVGDVASINIRGWAFDRDDYGANVGIHIYIDGDSAHGNCIYNGVADVSRADVNEAHGGVPGNNHGFDMTIPTTLTGAHEVYIYAIDVNGVTNPLIGTYTVNITADTTPPVISDVKITDLDKTGYTVSCTVTDNNALYGVQFPTWTLANEQDDLPKEWPIVLAPQAENVYTFRVNISDHNNEGGDYVTHIYARDISGNVGDVRGAGVYIDLTPPVISDAKITDIDETGYTVTCTVTDNTEVDRVQFPTWTSTNSQDDIVHDWQTNPISSGVKNGNTYTFRVKFSDHNNEKVGYRTHIAAYDKYGNESKVYLDTNGYIAAQYTIDYNANGGSGAPSAQSKTHDKELSLSTTIPTREGYTFLGWATSANATTATYRPGDAYTENASMTLYAIWEEGCAIHNYTTQVTAPTCTAQGYTTHTCSVCGNSYKDTYTNATGHSYSYKATKAPTTSATGTLTGTCSKCKGTTTVTLPKLNTTDYTYKVTKSATCTTTGTGRYTWKRTSYGSFYFDVTIAATGHSYKTTVTEPTCTAQGYTTHTCSVCGDSYKDTYTNATDHSYSGGSCTRCGAADPNAQPPVEDCDVIFTLGDVSGKPGETVHIELTVESMVKINSIALCSFSYDSSVLTFVGFEDYEAIADKAVLSSFDKENGTITIGLNPAEVYSGKICNLVFTINEETAEGTVATVQASSIVKLNSTNCTTYVDSAEIMVRTQLLGDIDSNETVDINDALLLFQHSMLPAIYPVEYVGSIDFNKDGTLDINDALRLFQYSMLPDIYPIA